ELTRGRRFALRFREIIFRHAPATRPLGQTAAIKIVFLELQIPAGLRARRPIRLSADLGSRKAPRLDLAAGAAHRAVAMMRTASFALGGGLVATRVVVGDAGRARAGGFVQVGSIPRIAAPSSA